jgi:hypothetical protein
MRIRVSDRNNLHRSALEPVLLSNGMDGLDGAPAPWPAEGVPGSDQDCQQPGPRPNDKHTLHCLRRCCEAWSKSKGQSVASPIYCFPRIGWSGRLLS